MNTIENVFFIVNNTKIIGIVKSLANIYDIEDSVRINCHENLMVVPIRYFSDLKFILNFGGTFDITLQTIHGEVRLSIPLELKNIIDKIITERYKSE